MQPFHADISIASSAGAGSTELFNPKTAGPPASPGICITRLSISTDTAMRIAVGFADQDGQRVRAGYFAANGGMAPDVQLTTYLGGPVYVFMALAGNVEVAIEGYYLDPPTG